MKITRQQWETAYHEAGHAAACLYYRIAFVSVSVIADNDSLGKVIGTTKKTFYKKLEYARLTPHVKDRLNKDMIMTLSGTAAQAKFRGVRRLSTGNQKDHEQVAHTCLFLYQSATSAGLLIKHLEEEARELFRTGDDSLGYLWKFVEVLANELIKNRKMTYAKCKKLYIETIGFYYTA